MNNNMENSAIGQRKSAGRRSKDLKNNNRITAYFDDNCINKIHVYGNEIGSLNKSNTVRSIVIRFLNNHSPECQPVGN